MAMTSPLRAPLFVPADRPERFAKAAASGADAVILDLEDAVAAGRKEEARRQIRVDFTHLPVLLRINPIGTPWHEADVAAAMVLRPAALVVPKAEDPRHLEALAGSTGLPLVPLVETACGMAEVRRIAALPGIRGLAFGSLDYAVDLGCAHMCEALLTARCELVLAARLAGIPAPTDGVTPQVGDLQATIEDAGHARALGMGGKLCIHPQQVSGVLASFRPTEAEVEWARRIANAGDGASAVDGEMVDAPVRARARAILIAAGSEA